MPGHWPQLAALTTYKGHEILTRTKELAESLLLDVGCQREASFI